MIITGFVLGLISSFHCIGMCGPLILALPVQHLPAWRRSWALILYHLGRISVYTAFGLILGLAGRRIYIAGFQQWFSIALGIFVLFLLLQYVLHKKQWQPQLFKNLYQEIQHWIIRLWKAPSKSSFFLLGVANGLLPCGMVYLAVAGALSLSHVKYSVLFMSMYGMGTLPALFALSYFGSFISLEARNNIKKLMPFFIGAMGVILILRGLNLGIPFISPVLGAAPANPVSCH